jgi:Xaa-Pro aminopeptidase
MGNKIFDALAQPVSRRAVFAAGAAGLAAGQATAAAAPKAQESAPRLPDLGFLRDTPLLNADRLRFVMKNAGVDALAVTRQANVFYLSNHWPQLDRMGFDDSAIAIFSADPAAPLALVMHAFLYYYTHSPESAFRDRLVYPYTQALDPAAIASTDGSEPAAAPARTMKVLDQSLVTPRDRHRASMFALTKPVSVDASWALKKAITALGLAGKRIGIDAPVLEGALKLRGFEGPIVAGENILRQARLAKSPSEIRLMRIAAQNNVDAALATATRARALGTTRALRADFYAEAARRGNHGHFMVISGTSTEVLDEPLNDGTSVSIDCVSTCRFYHGDFGRTIFIGEPRLAVQRAARAVATAWQDIRVQLRPGMKFSDIPRIGRESLKKQGADINVSFSPHAVGLFHTDHPQPSLVAARAADQLALEENMILSVDCPVFLSGAGGTVHLEDLMLIGRTGAEPIHTVPPPVVIV